MEDPLQLILAGLDREILIRLVLAVVLGGLIGLEREFRGRAAGLRTLIIVCLGATIIMIVSTRLAAQFFTGPGEAVVRVDPGRIAAGIVTGIGFLGAGVVLKIGDIVRGVTTAAAIWFVAALGITIGEGHYGLAIAATAVALVVLWLFNFMEAGFSAALYRTVTLKVDAEHARDARGKAQKILEKSRARMQDLKVCEEVASGQTELCFFIKVRQRYQALDVVNEIKAIDGVHRVEWS
jgi:putative Mg2+ transporter-C (MgtC) family protein